MKLYDWQIPYKDEIKRVIENRKSGLLVAPPGGGKTYVGSSLLSEIGGRGLVLCPKSVIGTWEKVLEGFGLGDDTHVLNYEQLTGRTKLAKDRTLGNYVGKNAFDWKLPKDFFILFDEAHRCNGRNTKSGLLLSGAKRADLRHLSMTATPPDDPLKMKNIGISLDLFPRTGFWDWAMVNGVRRSPWHKGFEFPQRSEAEKEMAEVYLSRIRESIFEGEDPRGVLIPMEEVLKHYPEGRTYVESVTVNERQQAKMEKEYSEELKELETLAEEAELRMIENLRIHQYWELLKVSPMLEQAKDLLDQGYSVALFVNFRQSAEALAKGLKTKSVIMGGVNYRDRIMERFQSNEVKVIVITASAGGEAISLHDVEGGHPRVGLHSPVWNPVTFRQVLGRLWRAGGKTPVVQKILLVPGIEERIFKRVHQRLGNMNSVTGDTFDPFERRES